MVLLFDRDLGCALRPNMTFYTVVRGRGQLCRTNTLGFRSDFDYKRRRRPDTWARAILIGDSFAEGHQLANSTRFSDQTASAAPGLEILNFAVAGTGTDQQLCIYRRYTKRFEHDFLILAPTDI